MCGRQTLAKVTALLDANNIPRILSTPFLISTAFNRRENHFLHSSFKASLFHCLCKEMSHTVSKNSTPFKVKITQQMVELSSCVAVPRRNWTLLHCIFRSCYCVRISGASIKGGADMHWLNSWILTVFIQRIWAPALTDVLHYSTSNAVMRTKYATE